jgi:uncharacterized protein (DUF1330 family)
MPIRSRLALAVWPVNRLFQAYSLPAGFHRTVAVGSPVRTEPEIERLTMCYQRLVVDCRSVGFTQGKNMSAFFVAQVKVKDGKKFQAYGAQAKAIFAEFGAETIARGKVTGSIAGELTHDVAAIIKFPDMQKLEAAFATDAYKAIIPLRDEAADLTIVKYEQSV